MELGLLGCTSLNDINKEILKKTNVSFGYTAISKFEIPEGIIKTPDYYLTGCYLIKNINLPTSLKTISQYSFARMSIETITIPEGVTSLENHVFEFSTNLTEIILPSSLKILGESTFENCGIKELIIPDGIERIPKKCFYKCSKLTNIIFPSSLNEIGDLSFGGEINFDFCTCNKITTIKIPEGVTKIGISCFENSTHLTQIILPSSLKKIGDYAFANTSIEELKLPINVKMNINITYKCNNIKSLIDYKKLDINIFTNDFIMEDDFQEYLKKKREFRPQSIKRNF